MNRMMLVPLFGLLAPTATPTQRVGGGGSKVPGRSTNFQSRKFQAFLAAKQHHQQNMDRKI